jgi:hypothetical protein
LDDIGDEIVRWTVREGPLHSSGDRAALLLWGFALVSDAAVPLRHNPRDIADPSGPEHELGSSEEFRDGDLLGTGDGEDLDRLPRSHHFADDIAGVDIGEVANKVIGQRLPVRV